MKMKNISHGNNCSKTKGTFINITWLVVKFILLLVVSPINFCGSNTSREKQLTRRNLIGSEFEKLQQLTYRILNQLDKLSNFPLYHIYSDETFQPIPLSTFKTQSIRMHRFDFQNSLRAFWSPNKEATLAGTRKPYYFDSRKYDSPKKDWVGG